MLYLCLLKQSDQSKWIGNTGACPLSAQARLCHSCCMCVMWKLRSLCLGFSGPARHHYVRHVFRRINYAGLWMPVLNVFVLDVFPSLFCCSLNISPLACPRRFQISWWRRYIFYSNPASDRSGLYSDGLLATKDITIGTSGHDKLLRQLLHQHG